MNKTFMTSPYPISGIVHIVSTITDSWSTTAIVLVSVEPGNRISDVHGRLVKSVYNSRNSFIRSGYCKKIWQSCLSFSFCYIISFHNKKSLLGRPENCTKNWILAFIFFFDLLNRIFKSNQLCINNFDVILWLLCLFWLFWHINPF